MHFSGSISPDLPSPMIARNKNIHSQSSSNLKKSHSKSMAIKIVDSAIIDLVQPPLIDDS